MDLPKLKATRDNISVTSQFLGINKGLHINESEFEDMKNMSNDYYPVITNRKKRGVIRTLNKPLGFLGGEKLVYIDAIFDEDGNETDHLFYNESIVSRVKLNPDYVGRERQMVRMGAYLCIFPDGIIYNTYDESEEVSTIQNEYTSSGIVEMRMCKLDGTEFTDENTFIGSTEPEHLSDEHPDGYLYWLDTSNSKQVILKMWAESYSMWSSVATTYVKIKAKGIGKGIKEYDAVRLSGIKVKGYNDFDFNWKKDNQNTMIVFACDDDYIIVAALMDLYHIQSDPITVKRNLPKMDFVTELDNRIWGCSSENHEIYACKQGSPWNWESFAGLDSDSFAATVGTQGDFTGAISYAGYVFFFKEEGFHKVYGNKPSNYEMLWKPCRGVQKGCEKSLAIVDETLIFKSRDAIVLYDGSENTISSNLGIEPYYDAVGVGYRNKYYVSMRDADYNYHIYTFDITKGSWCIEDNKILKYAVYANNGTYIVDIDNNLYVINNEKIYTKWFPSEDIYPSEDLYAGDVVEGKLEDNLEWSLTTGDLGLDNPYNKYLKRINVRMQLDISTKLKIEVEYDSSGEWEYVTEYYAKQKKSYEIPIVVKRADHVRIRFSGWGEFKLFSIAKAVEAGSGENEQS